MSDYLTSRVNLEDGKKFEIKAINVDQVAKEFAEIKNTMTIILFVACRNECTEQYEQKTKNKACFQLSKL